MNIKIISFLTIVIFIFALSQAGAERIYSDRTAEIDVSGNMICNTSASLMKKALTNVKGVQTVEIDKTEKTVIVTYDETLTDVSKMEEALSKAGFKANDKDADLMGYESLPGCCKTK